MQIDVGDIQDGNMNGEIIWVCDYRREDVHKKPTRLIRPTRVLVRPNEELPRNKNIYYSQSFLSPLKATDAPMATVISVVDNTGYRYHSGNPLYAYTTEEECVDKWNELVRVVVDKLQHMEDNAAIGWRTEKEKLAMELKL